MIFYFSGTGNSLYVAKKIAQYIDESLISIADVISNEVGLHKFYLKKDEVIGFVYPTHAWQPPEMVIKFIEKLKLNNYKNNYIFTVVTCGEDIGNTIKTIYNCLKRKNLDLKSGFSIPMPENYIILDNVDTKEVENKKLLDAEVSLKYINNIIKQRKEDVYKFDKGPIAGIRSSIINLMFKKLGTSTKKFYANDNCTGCGLCEKVCNSKTIEVKGKPIWGKECSQCLACINLCPVNAIQCGKGTERKGRYKNPNINVNEMIIN